jgi:Ca2+-binding RTX toxin-like protein
MPDRARIEVLERRQLLHASPFISSGALYIEADPAGGHVTIESTPTGARVISREVGGAMRTFNLVGTYASVYFTGSDARDEVFVRTDADKYVVISGRDGPDRINAIEARRGVNLFGEGGIDNIVGSHLGDYIDGGADGDEIFAEAGDDQILGGDGDDQIVAGVGHDTVDGGRGNDTIAAASEINEIERSLDDYVDTIRFDSATAGVSVRLGTSMCGDGTGGTDYLSHAFEVVVGTSFNDYIAGSEAANRLHGMNGNDTLIGGLGNDSCYGGAGADRLYGGADDDYLSGGTGGDFFDGGTGHDRAATELLELAINCEQIIVTGSILPSPPPLLP